jgi:hypothetical protein
MAALIVAYVVRTARRSSGTAPRRPRPNRLNTEVLTMHVVVHHRISDPE